MVERDGAGWGDVTRKLVHASPRLLGGRRIGRNSLPRTRTQREIERARRPVGVWGQQHIRKMRV